MVIVTVLARSAGRRGVVVGSARCEIAHGEILLRLCGCVRSENPGGSGSRSRRDAPRDHWRHRHRHRLRHRSGHALDHPSWDRPTQLARDTAACIRRVALLAQNCLIRRSPTPAHWAICVPSRWALAKSGPSALSLATSGSHTHHMTETGESATGRSRLHWLPWVLGSLAVLVVIGVTAGVVAAMSDDSSSSNASTGTQQLSSIQQACSQWRGSVSGSAVPSTDWCKSMVAWMNGQTRDGLPMGSMMWGSPDQLRGSCERWMSGTTATGRSSDRSSWCDQMVAWMTQHRDDWDSGWMPMMGR